MNNKRNKIAFIVIVLVLFISIGYAFLSTVLKINSSVSLNKVTFSIHFDNVQSATSNCVVNDDAHIINEDQTELSFSVNLRDVGEYYKFTTDVVNDSTIPGKLKSIELTGLTDSQKKFMKYHIYYTNNKKEVKVGDYIRNGDTKNITIELVYELDYSVTNEDVPEGNISVDCVLDINYENTNTSELNNKLILNQLSKDYVPYSTDLIDFERGLAESDRQGLLRMDSTMNDDYPIFFYRGTNSGVDNHLLYANKCWRIIRTTSTGGTKIIYNGIPNENGQCMNLDGDGVQAGSSGFDTKNGKYFWDDARNMKSFLYSWYIDNIYAYRDYVEDTPFCSDNQYTYGRVILDCDDSNKVTVANGRNDYPIGLITAEEVAIGGIPNTNLTPWLAINVKYWTMTGYKSNNSHAWLVYEGGQLQSNNSYSYSFQSFAIRPVISLSNEVTITSGDGTKEHPYTVDLI